MHTKISSGKEHRRHRARRASVLLVVLALLFTGGGPARTGRLHDKRGRDG